MAFTIITLIKVDDVCGDNSTKMSFGSPCCKMYIYAPSGTYYMEWKGVIDQVSGTKINNMSIEEFYSRHRTD